MDEVEKYYKQSEGKTKRGRGTNFATGLSGKNGSGGNSHSCTLCSKAHHLDDCAEFLKKPLVERTDVIKKKGFALVATVLNTLPRFAKVKEPVRKKHPTSLHDCSWKSEEMKTESGNGQHKKSEASEKKTCVLQSAM